jgi:thymidylate synthase
MDSYHKLLVDVMQNGRGHADRTGVGTRSVFGRQWRHDMQTGFPLLTTKRVTARWVFEELRWFLSGSTNNADLIAAGVDIWTEWATAEQCAKFGREEGDLGPVYGHLWRNFDGDYIAKTQGFDQIAQLLSDIQKSPNSRRLIVSGWHPAKATQVALPPCHTLYQLKCYEDTREISLSLYARSIDIFLGLPYNIASYAFLLSMIGFATGYTPLELVISFGDLHLYNNHAAQASEQLSRTPYVLPSLEISESARCATPLETLLNIKWEHIKINGYKHHPKIEADVAV